MSDDGFLARWSRRKVEAGRGDAPAAAPHPSPLLSGERDPVEESSTDETVVTSLSPLGRGTEGEGASPTPAPAELPPTMDDVAQLTPHSDYARFLSPAVDDSVKRAALKKLFADPHFNVMDGLDTYIDDYSRPDPLPLSMLRRMAQAQCLGLIDPEPGMQKTSPDGAAACAVPQSPIAPSAVATDEDPDLRLQQDDAAGPGGAGPGAA